MCENFGVIMALFIAFQFSHLIYRGGPKNFLGGLTMFCFFLFLFHFLFGVGGGICKRCMEFSKFLGFLRKFGE